MTSEAPEVLRATKRPATRGAVPPVATRTDERLVVACILDEFSAQCFGPEAEFVPLTPENWEVELCASQPDLLLVESAWRGHRQRWWNTVSRMPPELTGILAWCRERDVPTAFWNKEDPVHFTTFLGLAGLFDAVFTTDMDCVPRYKARLGHDRVHFLPFAAQPALHNPGEAYERIDGTAFAGAYYRRYPERIADLDSLSAALRKRGPLAIYDRNHGAGLPEYAFPEVFRKEIIGGLKPDEISVAYKGYTRNLNLNSVKQSQSMFARRVFELMASNTLVVSNFSRGLRLMFGDLVVSTDNGVEANRMLDALDGIDYGVEKVLVAAQRKVLSEHTYSHRLAFIAEVTGAAAPRSAGTRVLVVSRVASELELERVFKSVSRQSWMRVTLALCPAGTLSHERVEACAEAWNGCDLVVAHSLEAGDVHRLARDRACDLIAVFDPTDYYGRNYLTDAVLALGWTSELVVGKVRHFAQRSGALHGPTPEGSYRKWPELPTRASVMRLAELDRHPQSSSMMDMTTPGVAIDPFNYCRDGAALSSEALAMVEDLDLDVGLPLEALRQHASAATIELEYGDGGLLGLLFDDMPAGDEHVQISRGPDGPTIASTLPAETHRYYYSRERLDPAFLELDEDPFVHFEADPGLDLMLTLLFLGADGSRLGHVMVANMKNVRVSPPKETCAVRVGLRVCGSGRSTVRRFVPHQHHEASSGVLLRTRDVVLTNVYPAYDNLYRNGFIHTRVRAYKQSGRHVEVLLPREISRPVFREFEDVDIAELPIQELGACLGTGDIDNVLVHFLDRPMWEALRRAQGVRGIHVWIHGSEVQPWWRREYNFEDEHLLAEAKIASAERMALWQEVFRDAPANMHFVFVSRYFAEEVFEDVGVRLADDRYTIIHNPVDTSIFRYEPKGADQRRRVLTIRPYASRKYANDLSVEAVRILSQRPGFEDLHFCFIGDGPLFEQTTAPLRGLPNVDVRRQFLTHAEIARAHREFGVFLTPTRMDAQGVSRDEAMASGLVPVTSAVAAVPEFVDADCGFLAAPEDAEGLAEAIWRLAHDERLFSRLSLAAAERVRAQTAAEVIVPRELALFLG